MFIHFSFSYYFIFVFCMATNSIVQILFYFVFTSFHYKCVFYNYKYCKGFLIFKIFFVFIEFAPDLFLFQTQPLISILEFFSVFKNFLQNFSLFLNSPIEFYIVRFHCFRDLGKKIQSLQQTQIFKPNVVYIHAFCLIK